MKLFGALIGFVLVVVIGGFIYLSVADVSIEQTTITKNIPVSGN